MNKTLKESAFFFGVTYFVLITLVGDSIEHSFLVGDSVDEQNISLWTFILGERLLFYLGISFLLAIVFGLIAKKTNTLNSYSLVSAIAVATTSILLCVFLVFYNFLGVNPIWTIPLGFLVSCAFYILCHRVKRAWVRKNVV